MKAFLFEQYGYYPNHMENNSFVIDNWEFRLLQTNLTSETIINLENYAAIIRENFDNLGPFIIKTRTGNLESWFDNRKYVLVSVFRSSVSLQDLNKFHCLLKEPSEKMDLNNLINIWKEKTTLIEQSGVTSLRIDSSVYDSNLAISMYILGMCHNAVQYLSEIILDYGESEDSLCVTHMRLNTLNSFDFFNPFNMVLDHPIRDLIELCKNGQLQCEELIEILRYYNLNTKTASLMMARVMYPAKIIDQLEDNVYTNNPKIKLTYNIEKEFMRIKNIYTHLLNEYKIRPINWLS